MPETREVVQTLVRGQQGMLDPMVLRPEYASRLYNVAVRNGLAETRPGLEGQDLPVDGKFQGAFEYQMEGVDYWVVVVSGQVWVLNTMTSEWTLVDTFPTTDFDQAFFVQADRFCIVQNGIYEPEENWPIIFEYTELVDNLALPFIDSDGAYHETVSAFEDGSLGAEQVRVPIGTVMAFGHGRLFVAVDRYFNDGAVAGDPGWVTNLGKRFWMASNVMQVGDLSAFLVFQEGYKLTNALAPSLPAELGFITSMAFLRNAESGSGLGALIIFARRGAAAYAVNVTRNQWGRAGFGQVLFTSSGTNSHWGVAAVNSDLVYYGDGGLRTLKYSASNESSTGGLASVPIAPEIDNFTQHTDYPTQAPWVTLAHFDNYLFLTAGGVTLEDGSVGFRGALPWDLASFQVSGELPLRVFAGAWCSPGHLFHGVLAYRPTGRLGVIYRETETGPLRWGVFGAVTPETGAVSRLRTAAYTFEAALQLKRPKFIDVMLDRVTGTVRLWARWRVNGFSQWYESGVREFSGSNSATGLFRVPVDVAATVGHALEFELAWTGHARVKLAVFTASVLDVFAGDVGMCEVRELTPGTVEDEFCTEDGP